MILLEFKNGTKRQLLDHDGLWVRLTVKMEELNTIFKLFSRENMLHSKVLMDDQISYTFKNIDINTCTLEFGDQITASIVFKEVPISEIELAEARAKQEAMRNVFLIGMNHAAPEDVIRWCDELDGWHPE